MVMPSGVRSSAFMAVGISLAHICMAGIGYFLQNALKLCFGSFCSSRNVSNTISRTVLVMTVTAPLGLPGLPFLNCVAGFPMNSDLLRYYRKGTILFKYHFLVNITKNMKNLLSKKTSQKPSLLFSVAILVNIGSICGNCGNCSK